MKRSRKRLALKLAACAVAGAVVTMGVALLGSLSFRYDEMRPWTVAGSIDRRLASAYWSSTSMLADEHRQGAAAGEPLRFLRRSRDRQYVRDPGPAPYGNPPAPYTLSPPFSAWNFFEAGWPATALWGWVKRDVSLTAARSTRGGFVELPLLRERGTLPFPTNPLWPGFAIDTAFYGSLAFLLWSAPGFVRRRLRKRRGRCIACGYDLRGSGGGACPECGGANAHSTMLTRSCRPS